jgi:hypothetical protein
MSGWLDGCGGVQSMTPGSPEHGGDCSRHRRRSSGAAELILSPAQFVTAVTGYVRLSATLHMPTKPAVTRVVSPGPSVRGTGLTDLSRTVSPDWLLTGMPS